MRMNGYNIMPRFKGLFIRWELFTISQNFLISDNDNEKEKRNYDPIGSSTEQESVGIFDKLEDCAKKIALLEVANAKEQGMYSVEGQNLLVDQIKIIVDKAQIAANEIVKYN